MKGSTNTYKITAVQYCFNNACGKGSTVEVTCKNQDNLNLIPIKNVLVQGILANGVLKSIHNSKDPDIQFHDYDILYRMYHEVVL